MKKFIDLMFKDIYDEEFTTRECVIFGVIVPAGFLALLIIADTIERLFGNF